MGYEQQAQDLERYIRPDTFPLAVRVLKPGEELPPKAKQPWRDLGVRLSVCQAMGMARRYGWTISVSSADQSCPIAQIVFGFAPSLPFYEEGHLAYGMYCETLKAGNKAEAAIPKFSREEAGTLLIAPLQRAAFEPEIIVIYANSAQVMRLTAGALYQAGGYLPAKASPRADCADIVIGTLREKQAQVILPCYGDRVFGLTQDHEMCFTIPFSQLDELLKGLSGTEQGGVRYPLPVHLRVQADFPPNYKKLEAMWQAGEK